MISRLLFVTSVVSIFASSQVRAERWVVEFKNAPTEKVLSSIKRVKNVHSIERFDSYSSDYFNRLYLVETSSFKVAHPEGPNGDAERLRAIPEVKRVEGTFPIELNEQPSEQPPRFSEMQPTVASQINAASQWGLSNQGLAVFHDLSEVGIEITEGVKGIDIGWTSELSRKVDSKLTRDPLVAVLDTGLYLDHPRMQKTIAKTQVECTEEGHLPLNPKEDKDHNGYNGDCGVEFYIRRINGG